MYSSRIVYTGSYVPERIVTNDELSKIVDTNDEWISSRTGIKKRHVSEGENASDFATKTANAIIKRGNINPLDIELIIVATVSSDYSTPSTACVVQANIGAKNAVAFDITAACSGFVYALSVADKFIKTGVYKNVMVIGTEVLSKLTDWTDRTTCVLFGDGSAGAFVERSESGGIIAEDIGSDGEKGMSLTANHILPSNAFNGMEKEAPSCINMDGKAVFQFATRQVPKSINKIIEETKISIDDIKYVVPHQANYRIIEVISRKTGIPMDKFYINIENYANTSSATIPIALDEMVQAGMLERGDKILITGFGGGLTWGSMLIEW